MTGARPVATAVLLLTLTACSTGDPVAEPPLPPSPPASSTDAAPTTPCLLYTSDAADE